MNKTFLKFVYIFVCFLFFLVVSSIVVCFWMLGREANWKFGYEKKVEIRVSPIEKRVELLEKRVKILETRRVAEKIEN